MDPTIAIPVTPHRAIAVAAETVEVEFLQNFMTANDNAIITLHLGGHIERACLANSCGFVLAAPISFTQPSKPIPIPLWHHPRDLSAS
tara:strand:- start:7 stop:270 length:264 start_codon:yes stop_codon:yes gene_type:complete